MGGVVQSGYQRTMILHSIDQKYNFFVQAECTTELNKYNNCDVVHSGNRVDDFDLRELWQVYETKPETIINLLPMGCPVQRKTKRAHMANRQNHTHNGLLIDHYTCIYSRQCRRKNECVDRKHTQTGILLNIIRQSLGFGVQGLGFRVRVKFTNMYMYLILNGNIIGTSSHASNLQIGILICNTNVAVQQPISLKETCC